MDSFEWEVFKRSGSVDDYLQMKQREHEYSSYLTEIGEEFSPLV